MATKSLATDPHRPIRRTVTLRFYEELNDFLSPQQRRCCFEFSFTGHPSLKDLIEAVGVPHTEVELVIVDGKSVDFSYQLVGGERIAVYPVFEALDVAPLIRLRPRPLRHLRFIVDVNLGVLARKLRLLGFDTYYHNRLEDRQIVELSLQQKRVILTRDRGIFKYREVTHGYWIRHQQPERQVIEVIRRFQLEKSLQPFSRCSLCNGKLLRVAKQTVARHLNSDTLEAYSEFWQCNSCHKLYWKGSHYQKIRKWITQLQHGD